MRNDSFELTRRVALLQTRTRRAGWNRAMQEDHYKRTPLPGGHVKENSKYSAAAAP
eukprot:CAMPEP_0119382446 /NCGR_PEP_ID=MMETSP1334-20130426/72604_1 /TAXON_ID=127549 /ORGANISM="Calcidiscus leptoporus, Strain RCC1130" /LENGTH=55 /DNA_ID=CAMNT_0007402923 /DNA_START=135 /DNA_END=299 /DNA_ORIENTATION=-